MDSGALSIAISARVVCHSRDPIEVVGFPKGEVCMMTLHTETPRPLEGEWHTTDDMLTMVVIDKPALDM
jgi:hypothetical protein